MRSRNLWGNHKERYLCTFCVRSARLELLRHIALNTIRKAFDKQSVRAIDGRKSRPPESNFQTIFVRDRINFLLMRVCLISNSGRFGG